MSELIDQTPEPQSPYSNMPIGKTMLINFGIMLLYMVLTTLLMFSGPDGYMGAVAFDAIFILVQVGLNFLVGFILLFTNYKHVGGAMLISSLLLGVVGFGACLGKGTLLERL